MCSKTSPGAPALTRHEDLGSRLGNVIDELAAVAGADAEESGGHLAARLAAAWAIVAEADPELAERTARYAR
jgi:hypothetical protein